MTVRLRITIALLAASICVTALMLGGNLYEQIVNVRYYAHDPPRTLEFHRDIMRNGYFEFYAIAPLSILVALLAFGFAWKYKALRVWTGLAFLLLVLNAVITFQFAVPHLDAMFFPLREPLQRPPSELQEAIRQFKTVSIVRWGESFVGLLCSLWSFAAAVWMGAKTPR